ncbi:MAG: prepilin-type N-terminal cleavage/methylation domain-containing protein [Rhodospirillales bacterium]|nr:prepilin-type N-terminal cleavage/methylation domain-containing protein [Rhodospirillales bacterium]
MTESPSPAGKPRFRKCRRGFTLIEIVVALAILAVALGALFQAFSGGLRATAVADRRAAAVMLAQSLLDRIGQDIPLAAGEQAGESGDGLHWSITVVPSPLIAPERRADSPVIPFDVEVSVAADGGRTVTLTSLRLAPAAAGDGSPQ